MRLQVIAKLVHGLRARGLDSSTIWIVLGDHGEAFGQHEGNYGHTFFLYDENVRVPFLIAAPGTIPRQIHSRRVVSLIDAAPTVLDLAGLHAPEIYQGRSMLATEPRMALFFADYSLGLMGLRDGPLKFVHEVNSGRSKLFDVDRDPLETIDRSAQYPERARWYLENLQDWSAAQQKRLNF
jgi:lipoteichoic acid synthase